MTAELVEFDKQYGCVVGGIDEAGRGPLAGPVVCAVAVMPLDNMIDGVNDSKKISEGKREKLYSAIISTAIDYGVGIVDQREVDDLNILNATKLGMKRAFENLKRLPELIIIDAVKLDLPVKTVSVIKGDAKSYNVAAASIIAKVTRDAMMKECALKYPEYGFEKNKGYGTAEHIAALKRFGACPLHRRTFIKNFDLGGGHG